MAHSNTSVLLALLVLLSRLNSGCSKIHCLENERNALITFKESLTDKSSRLESWTGQNCCTWQGIVCSNRTGHVVELDLRNPITFDFHKMFEDGEFAKNYRNNCLGGELSPSLVNLTQLHHLDLSMNNFSGIEIPSFLGSLKNLRYLNLSSSGFGGKIPHHIGNLSNLEYLHLGDSARAFSPYTKYYILATDSLSWIARLSSLKSLDLSWVSLRGVRDWLPAINMLSYLSSLNLQGCHLHSIPSPCYLNFTRLISLDFQYNNIHSRVSPWLFNLTSLEYLKLDNNRFYGPIPDKIEQLTGIYALGLSGNNLNTSLSNSLCRLTSLVDLDVSSNHLRGSLPECLGNLSSLASLNLASNIFQGLVPSTLRNICSLRVLDLSGNGFGGVLPSFIRNPSGCIINSLRELYLEVNNFTDYLPDQIDRYKRVEILDFSFNSLLGPIPASIGRISELKELYVMENMLNGSVPTSLGQLSKLVKLDISKNSLTGLLSETNFEKLRELKEVVLSSNLLAFNLSSHWDPPFQLEVVEMRSITVGPKFPPWLQTQERVKRLVLYNSSISDELPGWFEQMYSQVDYLDLSYNQIRGSLPRFEETISSKRWIVLESNKFEGPLISFPSNVVLLDLSKKFLTGQVSLLEGSVNDRLLSYLVLSDNNLTGVISEGLCRIRTLRVMDLSKNMLSGEIPSCLGNLQSLELLDLAENNLSGNIPSSLGSLWQLYSLHLQRNQLNGKIPSTMKNLKWLYTLDLGENQLADTVPSWIGEALSNLGFLRLKSNNLHGEIPLQLCQISALQVLSLADNNMSGNIPRCFGNFTGMIHPISGYWGNEFNYQDNLIDFTKGRDLEYTKNLVYLKSIDLSCNNIVGEIPEELMGLIGLENMNLSNNHLTGRIPDKIGDVKQLESLDLSRNELYGEIPPTLPSLTYLSHLNLSYNNLSGRIPTGNQLQTLNDQSIYMGNKGLCGPPLLTRCPGDKPPDQGKDTQDENRDDELDILSVCTGLGPGFLTGFVGVIGLLAFKNSWRYALFRFVENSYDRLALVVALKASQVRRRFQKDRFQS